MLDVAICVYQIQSDQCRIFLPSLCFTGKLCNDTGMLQASWESLNISLYWHVNVLVSYHVACNVFNQEWEEIVPFTLSSKMVWKWIIDSDNCLLQSANKMVFSLSFRLHYSLHRWWCVPLQFFMSLLSKH